MGHIRIARLPKVRGWKEVISLLSTENSSPADISGATARAAKEYFGKIKTDPSLVFTYWLLTQITYKARTVDFANELCNIGLNIGEVTSALDFLSNIANFSRVQIKLRGESFPLSEFAQLSLREVLTETIGQHSKSLFGTTKEDIRLACRRYSNPNQFAKLARLYFSKITNRILQFFVSKESPNQVGKGRKFEDVSELADFNSALEGYCYQSAKIVEVFAGGWYSKRNWQGEISESDAQGFVAVAMKKLRTEIAREDWEDDD